MAMRFYQSSGGEHGPPRKSVHRTPIALLALVLLAAMSMVAGANTITLTLIDPGDMPINLGSGFFRYDYSVSLSQGSEVSLTNGSMFTLYDVGAYVLNSATFAPSHPVSTANGNVAGTFTMSEAGSGPAYGPSVYPPPGGDNSTIFNVTGTYIGPDYISPPTGLGILSLIAKNGAVDVLDVLSRDIRVGTGSV